MELAAFAAITKALQGVMNLANEFSKAEERKRERVAAWLQELSEVIQDIADKLELNLKHSSPSVERLESLQHTINYYHTHNWWNFALVPFLSFLWCKGHMSQVEDAFYSLLISNLSEQRPSPGRLRRSGHFLRFCLGKM